MDEKIEIVLSRENLQGGFIMYGSSGRKRVDCSFASRLESADRQFLGICKIPIEDGDLLNE